MTTSEAQTILDITPAEWEIMRVVWAQNQTTSNFIIQTLAEKMNWKPATIKTLIGRLIKKNWLLAEKATNRFLYSANITEKAALTAQIDKLLAAACAATADDIIIQMIEQAPLSTAMRDHIQKALQAKETVAAVPCNCVPGQCHCGSSHS